MVRKIPAAKKRTPERDSFFDVQSAKRESAAGGVVSASARPTAKLERQMAVLRHEVARLSEENERLKAAAAIAPYGWLELDRRGLILESNEAASRVLQCDPHALKGVAFVSFLHERAHQKFLSFLHHAFQTGISQSVELPIVHEDERETVIRMDCKQRENDAQRMSCVVSHMGAGGALGEEHFRMVADDAEAWMMWFGADGRLVWVNKGVELLTGYTPEECFAIPDFPYPLIAESDHETIAEVMAEGLRGGEESAVELRIRTKAGEEVWGSLSYHPIFDAAGLALGFTAAIRSIAEKKVLEEEVLAASRALDQAVRERTASLQQKNAALAEEAAMLTAALKAAHATEASEDAQASTHLIGAALPLPSEPAAPGTVPSVQKRPLKLSKRFFEQVIDALGDLVFVKNKDRRYILVNLSFIEYTGIAREEILGRTDHELFNADEAELFTASDNAVFEKKREFLVEEMLTRRDGQQRRILVKKDIYFDESGNPFIVGVIRDVTELRNAEDDMRAALAKEKELNELKSRFVSMVSHEYKTPLTAILSSAELLELFRKSWSDEKVNLHLQKIKRAVETMTEMLSDSLFLNKIETGRTQVVMNTFELVSFCIMIADEVQACATAPNTIETSTSVAHAQVSTDNKLLRYILTNLLSNAVKYSYPRTSIQFETVLGEQSVTFRVRNRGIGIPVESQRSIFEPFFRAPNTGTIQGTGLGLSIAKRCVDSLSGTITFESVPDEVTVFTVTIPMQVLEYQTGIARAVPSLMLAP